MLPLSLDVSDVERYKMPVSLLFEGSRLFSVNTRYYFIYVFLIASNSSIFRDTEIY